jgi:hypothetical protein
MELQLHDTALSPALIEACRKTALYTCRDVLMMSPLDIMERLNVPCATAHELLDHVAAAAAPPFMTVRSGVDMRSRPLC